jgi:hypothetical protein
MTDAEKIAYEVTAKTGGANLSDIYIEVVRAGLPIGDGVLAVRSLVERGFLDRDGIKVVLAKKLADSPAEPVQKVDNSQVAAEVVRRRVRRPQSRRLGTDKGRGLAERIVELLEHEGPRMLYRELCRRLSSHRYSEWMSAITWLEQHKAISLADGWIELIDEGAAERLRLAPPYPEEKPQKPKRNRGQSQWFQERYKQSLRTGQSVSEVIEQERFQRQASSSWPGWETFRT